MFRMDAPKLGDGAPPARESPFAVRHAQRLATGAQARRSCGLSAARRGRKEGES